MTIFQEISMYALLTLFLGEFGFLGSLAIFFSIHSLWALVGWISLGLFLAWAMIRIWFQYGGELMFWPFSSKKQKRILSDSALIVIELLKRNDVKEIGLHAYTPNSFIGSSYKRNSQTTHGSEKDCVLKGPYWYDEFTNLISKDMSKLHEIAIRSNIQSFWGHIPMIDFKTKDISQAWKTLEKFPGDWFVVDSGNSFHAFAFPITNRSLAPKQAIDRMT